MKTLIRATAWLALAAATVSVGCRGNRSTEPPVHLNKNMDFQAYYKAQEANDYFPDDRAMRPPVADTAGRALTVAWGRTTDAPDPLFLKEDDHYYRGRGPDERLIDALPSSVELNAALLARGQQRFQIYCRPCHGGLGEGDGLIMQKGFPIKPKSFHTARLKAMPLAYFVHVMSHGRGAMPSYAAQVPIADRWAIATYVRALQLSEAADKADVPAGITVETGGSPQ